MKKELTSPDWLTAPYNVRVFILQDLCRKGFCGQQKTFQALIELLKAYSLNFDKNYAFGANESLWRDNVLHFDDLIIAWDGESLLDICWYHVVRAIKKQLATPYVHEFMN